MFAAYNAYKVWTMKYNDQTFGKRPDQRKKEIDFCSKHNLSMRALHECLKLTNELKSRLEQMGVREMVGENRVQLSEKEKGIDKIQIHDNKKYLIIERMINVN